MATVQIQIPVTMLPRPFDLMIGQLDRLLSEFLLAAEGELDAADRQTIKHHADDLIGVGNAALKRLQAANHQNVKAYRELDPAHDPTGLAGKNPLAPTFPRMQDTPVLGRDVGRNDGTRDPNWGTERDKHP